MKTWPVLLLLHLSIALVAQVHTGTAINKPSGSGNTYAVIVGISTYESPGIPQLEFAHKDAQYFASYLKSKAGGNVPEDNIRLLINEDAGFAAMYDALSWLLTTVHKDDLVYFYFSGHGDMENTTIYNLGYLLSYNTPRTNYINNALRIEDLNNIANTLSVKINARVVLITDACHSGKLAGSDNRGTYLVGDQLRTVQNKEIRITSCAPDQLSAEDPGWGGGRGVFSYYLVNGLEGMADENQDKTITVSEIKNYLDSSLAADALLAQKAMKQSPVIKGNDRFTLAQVDLASLNALKTAAAPVIVSRGNAPIVMSALAPLPPQPQTFFFNLFQHSPPEEWIDFTALDKFSKEEIPFACLQMLLDTLRSVSREKAEDFLQVIDTAKIGLLQRTLRQNKDALGRFNNKLAVLLSDRGQEIINHYLEGDAAELEKRRYYNSRSTGYDVYPHMFSVALKLTPPENYLSKILAIKLHYFSGVAARLKIPAVENPQPLLAVAMDEQKKAFQLEENAAYIQNELGVLYLLKNELPEAEKYFVRATEIAPKWAIPWANLAGLYASLKKYDKAQNASATAIQLQPDYPGAYINNGFVCEQTGKQLQAEELFRKSIHLNSRDYLPFERLGFVYISTTQYALADSFFYEADQRKKGFHFTGHPQRYVMPPVAAAASELLPCEFDSADVGKQDVMGHFAWGYTAFLTANLPVAEREFKKVIAIDKSNPLAFRWLGKLLYKQKRWEEAAIIFKYAIEYYLGKTAFNHYCDSVAKTMHQTKSKECFVTTFRFCNYSRVHDFYFSGRMYEQWNHFGEAEAAYRTIMHMDSTAIGGFYLLWNMFENMGRYKDAEETILAYTKYNKPSGQNALSDFYKRMTTRFAGNGEWFYKAGQFFYRLAETNPEAYKFDKKTIDVDTYREHYVIEGFGRAPAESIELPGIGEWVRPPKAIDFPRTLGISYLIQADSLLANDDDAVADINYKIGDLHAWQGLPEKAAPYYEKSIALKPDDANTRLKLVDIYDSSYQFSAAFAHLDSLYNRHAINFEKQLLMAKYDIHNSRFDEAAALLNTAEQIHPYKMPAISDLRGRMYMLSNNPKEAMRFYKDFLLVKPDAAATYSIAKLYEKTKDEVNAWKWLELSMARGFRYHWVLQYDETWNAYRKKEKWAALLKRYPSKKYANTAGGGN